MKQYPAKPFVKWAGGKGQLLTTLGQALPETFCNIEDAVYIEPFVGGGAMLFFMLQNFGNIKKAVISDVNTNLIKAYEVSSTLPNVLSASYRKFRIHIGKSRKQINGKSSISTYAKSSIRAGCPISIIRHILFF